MENYIIHTHRGTKIVLENKAVENLKMYIPKGCPFSGYTLFDLLMDLINMYSWKVYGKKSIKEFIELLQQQNYSYAVVYGNDIVQILNYRGGSTHGK